MDTWNHKYISVSALKCYRGCPKCQPKGMPKEIVDCDTDAPGSDICVRMHMKGIFDRLWYMLPLMNLNDLHQKQILERLDLEWFQHMQCLHVATRQRLKAHRFVKRIWILGNAAVCHQRGCPLAYALVQQTYATVPRDWTLLESSWSWWVLC